MQSEEAREVRTTCPYCGVGCGVLARIDADGTVSCPWRSRTSSEFRPPLLKGVGARRDRRSGRPTASSRNRRAARWLGRGARPRCLDLRPDHRRARSGCGRLLRLGPVADRGLLRRQQADEGLHRLGQHRHQLAPLHGILGSRPPPRLRLRHRARHLRGSRTGRSRRAGRLEPRLVPPGAATSASRRRRRRGPR